jgi:hypothetical protein
VGLELLREAGDHRVKLGAALLALEDDIERGAREDAMAQRIERGARLSFRRLRAGGGLRIGAIGVGLCAH